MRKSGVLVILVVVCMVMAAAISARTPKKSAQRTESTIKSEQKAATKSIKESSKKLAETTDRTKKSLEQLSKIDGELSANNAKIETLRNSLDSLDQRIRTVGDSVSGLQDKLVQLKGSYAKALRSMQGGVKPGDVLAFIFSGNSFKEMTARYRYLKEIASWRKRKIKEIEQLRDLIVSKRESLGKMQKSRTGTINTLMASEQDLQRQKSETDRLINELKKEGTALQASIARNQQKLNKLNSELDRLIAAQQNRAKTEKRNNNTSKNPRDEKKSRPASTPGNDKNQSNVAKGEGDKTAYTVLPSGGFEANKGRLPFPVNGRYTVVRKFGRTPMPDMPDIMTDNSGIDITMAPGTQARAIFDGQVSGVFPQDGYNNVVMIRHGNYISIYANIGKVFVRSGDKIKTSQAIGVPATDSQYGGKGFMHFELRKERTKLNPLSWVR